MQAIPNLQLDNAWVRVTEWRFPPGAETGWHRHEYSYVVVPITSGKLRLEDRSGVKEADLVAGAAYSREKGIEHNVINPNAFEFRFIEIEVLSQALTTATGP